MVVSRLPQVRQIIVDTLRCARGEIRARKESFEVYGFDIMIDAGMRPWLLEANLSPDMRHTTPLKKRIGPRMVEGLLSLVVDVGLDRLAQAPVRRTSSLSTYPPMPRRQSSACDCHKPAIARAHLSRGGQTFHFGELFDAYSRFCRGSLATSLLIAANPPPR